MTTRRAVVVGSGPNGLTAAVVLARAGVEVRVVEGADRIGGGTRTSELTEPGVLHDDCSAIHPTGVMSPIFRQLGLERYGLEWVWPEIDLAHPLDDGTAGLMYRDLERTADGLGVDGTRWKRVFGPAARRFDALTDDVFGPIVGIPKHPFTLASFGLRALLPAHLLAKVFSTEQAKALFGGVAAHSYTRLDTPLSSAVGIMLTAAGHAGGWPVARGGSISIASALAAALADAGGTIETGITVTSIDELGNPDIVMLDTSPLSAASIAAGRLPSRVERAYRSYRYGAAAHKIDLAIRGEVPWTNKQCRKAGTVHVGGTFDEFAEAERQVNDGMLPEAPFVLVGQQHLVDPARSEGDVHPLWLYGHVPHGHRDDDLATERILAQLERFAPGVRDQIVSMHVRGAMAMQQYNPNYVGGDIATGFNGARQVVFRPRATLSPYSTGADGVWLCSAATPPGAGVHGMCGANAARAALAQAGIS